MDLLMAPPKTRPFRLIVHILPPAASKNRSIDPEEVFLLLSTRGTTIRDLCPKIVEFFKSGYGRDIDIKKCQTKDGADIGLDHLIEDVFDDKEVIRIIQSYATPTNRDSVPPTSGLRPGAFLKRARSQSLRPGAPGGLGKIVEERESPAASPGTVRPNKRQRILDNDPDRPIRSRERDAEELRETPVNGRRTPGSLVEDSQVPASIVEETQTGADVSTSTLGYNSTPPSSPELQLRSFLEIESEPVTDNYVSIKNTFSSILPKVNGTSDNTLGSPFHEPLHRNLSRAISTDTNRLRWSGDHNERLRATSTAATTPQSVDAQPTVATTESKLNGRLKRPDASMIKPKPKPAQIYPGSQRRDVYDDIETDREEEAATASSKVSGFTPVNINGSRPHVKVNGVNSSANSVDDMDLDEPANVADEQAEEPSPKSAAGLAAERRDLERKKETAEKMATENKAKVREEEEERERVQQAAVDVIKHAEEAANVELEKTRLATEAEKIRVQAEKEVEDEEFVQQNAEEEKRKSIEEERQENLRQNSRERSQKEAAERRKRDESAKRQKEVEVEKANRRKSEKAAETARAAAKKVEVDAAKSNARTPLKTAASRFTSSQASGKGAADSPATAMAKAKLWTDKDNTKLVVAHANQWSWSHMVDKYFPTRTPKAVSSHFAELKKKPGVIDGIKAKGLTIKDLESDTEDEEEEEAADSDASDEIAETRNVLARTPVKSKSPGLPNSREKTPSSILRRTASKTSPFPRPPSRNGSSIPRSSQEPLDVSLEAQMPLPPRRSVSFAEDVSPPSGQKQPAQTTTMRSSASSQPSNTPIPPPAKKSPGTLRQTQIIKPQLGYTGAPRSTPPEKKVITRATSRPIVPSTRLASQPPLAFTPAGTRSAKSKAKEVIELSSADDMSDSDDYEDDDGGVNLASPDKKRAYAPNPIIPPSLQMPSSQLPRGRLTRSETMFKNTVNQANATSTPSIPNKNQKPITPSDPTPKRSDSTPASPPRDSHSPVGFRESHQPSPASSSHKPSDSPTKNNLNDSEEDNGSSDDESDYQDTTPRRRSSHSPPIYLNTQEENEMDVDDSENELPPPKSSASTRPVYGRVDPTSERDLDALVQSQIRRDTSTDRALPSTQPIPLSSQSKGTASVLTRPGVSGRHRYSLQRMNQDKPKVDYAAVRAASSQKKPEPIEEEEEEEEEEDSDSDSDSSSDSSSDSDSDSNSDSDDAGKLPASTQPLPKKKKTRDDRQLMSDGATPRAKKRGAGNEYKKSKKDTSFSSIQKLLTAGLSQKK